MSIKTTPSSGSTLRDLLMVSMKWRDDYSKTNLFQCSYSDYSKTVNLPFKLLLCKTIAHTHWWYTHPQLNEQRERSCTDQ